MTRLLLCLSLFVTTAGFAQNAEPSPPAPAEETPSQPAPRGEVFPRERNWGAGEAVRFAGRFILLPPAGIVAGLLAGFGGVLPAFVIGAPACGNRPDNASLFSCLDTVLYTGFGVGASLGAGLGVIGVGYLLGGEARSGAVMAGALAGSVLGAAIVLSSADRSDNDSIVLLVSPAIGAALLYALSDAFFPKPSRVIPRDRDDKPKDEYVRVLPLLTPTARGGIVGGLVGRF